MVYLGRPCDHLLEQTGRLEAARADGADRGVKGNQFTHESTRLSGDHERESTHGICGYSRGQGALGDSVGSPDRWTEGESIAEAQPSECQVWNHWGRICAVAINIRFI